MNGMAAMVVQPGGYFICNPKCRIGITTESK